MLEFRQYYTRAYTRETYFTPMYFLLPLDFLLQSTSGLIHDSLKALYNCFPYIYLA